MATRAAANAVVKRTAFSSAINIFPNEIAATMDPSALTSDQPNGPMSRSPEIKSYSEIPGPKELPFVGNSWRFAPIIGKHFFFVERNSQIIFELIRH